LPDHLFSAHTPVSGPLGRHQGPPAVIGCLGPPGAHAARRGELEAEGVSEGKAGGGPGGSPGGCAVRRVTGKLAHGATDGGHHRGAGGGGPGAVRRRPSEGRPVSQSGEGKFSGAPAPRPTVNRKVLRPSFQQGGLRAARLKKENHRRGRRKWFRLGAASRVRGFHVNREFPVRAAAGNGLDNDPAGPGQKARGGALCSLEVGGWSRSRDAPNSAPPQPATPGGGPAAGRFKGSRGWNRNWNLGKTQLRRQGPRSHSGLTPNTPGVKMVLPPVARPNRQEGRTSGAPDRDGAHGLAVRLLSRSSGVESRRSNRHTPS